MVDEKNVNEYTDLKKVITTTIPISMAEEIKTRGWSFQELLIEGFFQRKGQPNWKERIKELEEKVSRISAKLSETSQKNYELGEKLKDLGEKNG